MLQYPDVCNCRGAVKIEGPIESLYEGDLGFVCAMEQTLLRI